MQFFSFFVFVMLARLLDKPAIGTFAIAFVFMDVGRNRTRWRVQQLPERRRSQNVSSTRSSDELLSLPLTPW